MKNRLQKKAFYYNEESALNSYTVQQIKGKYPHGGYTIEGEVLKKNYDRSKIDNKLYVQPIGKYRWPLYRNISYLSYNSDTFIAVKRINFPLLFISFITVICIIIAGIFALNYFEEKPDIDPRASKYKSQIKRPEGADYSSILVPGYDDWSMKAGTDTIYMALFNPEDNPCYFKFIVTRDDDNTTLFQTKLVPPGSAVTEIKLPYELKQGIYPITVEIKSYSIDNPSEPMNGAEMKTRIIAIK
ncbi:hypothetical protein ACRVLY_002869 [Listeria monocytogenes]|uniref:hypothetical protein n=1 Tax=Listeria monocytogenes TaxID=1639 RepID=UPI000873D267|nr:hypothetical protein [Listeria monocytogenes]EAC3357102.1 hypothetical protein [Listeria monocytogenes]EAC7182534.1 hypothetical protein [Listeria monocytogenes]EAC8000830.1 hypothetical protein [Listeria monocytogenes]EAC8350988.1 hypothetical protein [Listeria monocytogenes]EAC9519346.1 hypothetical protein [Listeria monocytogenes]